ncbi:MAG: amino acid ABC transporter permease [Oscillospiraceae bacterium]|nr:amino acid ABC transporter permease [Oscillospiraceae bacterium]
MFWTVTEAILKGCGEAAQLFFFTLLFALPLGLLIAFGSMSKWQPLRSVNYLRERRKTGIFKYLYSWRPVAQLFDIIVWVMRGTPLILQLIIIFYGPGMWFDVNPWNFLPDGRMFACVLAFVINYACYFSVIYRGDIEGVPVGQREAGEVLGMTKRQIFFKITLLQMIKRIVPPMSNEIITLVKDTSLARVIAITEIIKAGEKFMKSDGITWPLFYTAVFYLVFVGILTILFNFIERKLSYFR